MIERNKFDGVIDALRQINCHFSDLGLDESLRQICAIKQSFDIKVMVGRAISMQERLLCSMASLSAQDFSQRHRHLRLLLQQSCAMTRASRHLPIELTEKEKH